MLYAIAGALCACSPSEASKVARYACQTAAVADANAAADRECGAYESWEACPESKEIEAILLADLEACDGDS